MGYQVQNKDKTLLISITLKIMNILMFLLICAVLWGVFFFGGYIALYLIIGYIFVGLSQLWILIPSILWFIALIYFILWKKTDSRLIKYSLLSIFLILLILPSFGWLLI